MRLKKHICLVWPAPCCLQRYLSVPPSWYRLSPLFTTDVCNDTWYNISCPPNCAANYIFFGGFLVAMYITTHLNCFCPRPHCVLFIQILPILLMKALFLVTRVSVVALTHTVVEGPLINAQQPLQDCCVQDTSPASLHISALLLFSRTCAQYKNFWSQGQHSEKVACTHHPAKPSQVIKVPPPCFSRTPYTPQ